MATVTISKLPENKYNIQDFDYLSKHGNNHIVVLKNDNQGNQFLVADSVPLKDRAIIILANIPWVRNFNFVKNGLERIDREQLDGFIHFVDTMCHVLNDNTVLQTLLPGENGQELTSFRAGDIQKYINIAASNTTKMKEARTHLINAAQQSLTSLGIDQKLPLDKNILVRKLPFSDDIEKILMRSGNLSSKSCQGDRRNIIDRVAQCLLSVACQPGQSLPKLTSLRERVEQACQGKLVSTHRDDVEINHHFSLQPHEIYKADNERVMDRSWTVSGTIQMDIVRVLDKYSRDINTDQAKAEVRELLMLSYVQQGWHNYSQGKTVGPIASTQVGDSSGLSAPLKPPRTFKSSVTNSSIVLSNTDNTGQEKIEIAPSPVSNNHDVQKNDIPLPPPILKDNPAVILNDKKVNNSDRPLYLDDIADAAKKKSDNLRKTFPSGNITCLYESELPKGVSVKEITTIPAGLFKKRDNDTRPPPVILKDDSALRDAPKKEHKNKVLPSVDPLQALMEGVRAKMLNRRGAISTSSVNSIKANIDFAAAKAEAEAEYTAAEAKHAAAKAAVGNPSVHHDAEVAATELIAAKVKLDEATAAYEEDKIWEDQA